MKEALEFLRLHNMSIPPLDSIWLVKKKVPPRESRLAGRLEAMFRMRRLLSAPNFNILAALLAHAITIVSILIVDYLFTIHYDRDLCATAVFRIYTVHFFFSTLLIHPRYLDIFFFGKQQFPGYFVRLTGQFPRSTTGSGKLNLHTQPGVAGVVPWSGL